MSELNFSLLEQLPESALCIEYGIITAVNARCRALLPELHPGQPLPDFLIPAAASSGAGTFHSGEHDYQFAVSGNGDQYLLFFSPISNEVSTAPLGDIVAQLRQCIAPMMEKLAPLLGPDGDRTLDGSVTKSLYRLFRVMDNTDFLACTAKWESLSNPVPVDLVSLCSRLTMNTESLLKELKVGLRFECRLPALILSGDPVLLDRLLLELIANSAKVTPPGGEILLRLTQAGRQALLTIQDGGGEAEAVELMAAMSGRAAHHLPRPGQGAGLGLSVAQRIAHLHHGMLMVTGGQEHATILSLPITSAHTGVHVRTPQIQTDGGLSPLLIGLCDLLPSRVFDQVSIS